MWIYKKEPGFTKELCCAFLYMHTSVFLFFFFFPRGMGLAVSCFADVTISARVEQGHAWAVWIS